MSADSKSEKIRQLGLTGLKPKEIADKLKAEGVDVKATYVSMILSKERRKNASGAVVASPVVPATSFPEVQASTAVVAPAAPVTTDKVDAKKEAAKAKRQAKANEAAKVKSETKPESKPSEQSSLVPGTMISVDYVCAARDYVSLCGGIGPAQLSLDSYAKIVNA